jgi:nucleotide-binding universal stress UspA family protein
MLVVPHSVTVAGPPRRVLLAVDGEELTLGEHGAAVRQVFAMLKAELTVLYVAPPTVRPEERPDFLESVLSTGLTADLPVQTRTVSHSNPAEAILQAAQPADYDMVMVMARERSFFGSLFHRSVTTQVLLNSEIPVLVLPAQ